MFQQPQAPYNQYGAQSQQQQGFNTSSSFYQSGGVASNRQSQLFQSPSQSTVPRTPDQQKDAMNNSTSIQTTYIPGYLIASQSGRGPPASVWASPSAKETTPTKEDENPFAKEAPIFRDSRGASTSFKASTPYTSRSSFTLAKATPRRSPGERQTPYSPEYTRNSPPSDEDSVPQVSLTDVIPTPRRNRAPAPDDSSFSLAASEISTVGAVKPIKLVIFGFPAHLTTRVIKDFTSFGKDQVLTQEEGPEGSNFIVIGYKDPALAARLVRRTGELLDGIYHIGIQYQDPRMRSGDSPFPSTSPVPDAGSISAPGTAVQPSKSLSAGHHLQTRASNVSLANTSALLPDPPKKSTLEWVASFFTPPAPAHNPTQILPPGLTGTPALAPGGAGAPVSGTQAASSTWGVTTAVNKVSELVFGW
ncbi:hypothetical protein CALVIDRAFT_551912 [Calocera viscosa TUFC12733]|uniref:RRM Nup35-type domain-containing protein n=1 Tax=Calocera viscosa (strain TUFC12733) TaxID=1330018 RepID=A0A167S263_CALVF|nr:hypothetical protein CALVIDRAFT_551912 [Calocera viscosa TUFC12733]